MTTGAFEDISTELKNAYPRGSFEDPVNKEAPFRKSLTRVDLKMNEGIATFPLGLASAWNVGAVADFGAFPTPIDPTRVQGQVSPELFVADFQIGIKTKAAAKSKVGTFNSGGILADRVESTIADLGKYINRVYAMSNAGRLAIVESNGTPSNYVILAKPLGAEMLNRNMRVEFRTTAGALQGTAGRKITLLDKDLRKLTYDGADIAGLAASDGVFMTGTYGRSFWTLPMIVDDGAVATDLFGKTKATYPELYGFVERGAAGLRDITEQIILDAIDKPRRETGKRITRLIANSGQGRMIVKMIQAERRYAGPQGSAPKYTIGYAENTIQILAPGVDVGLECDFDIEPRAMYGLAWETFGLYEAMPLDWIDDDNLLKMVPAATTATHIAGFAAYAGSVENMINVMPRANVKIEDLNDPICGD